MHSILNTFNRKISEDKDKNHEIIEINSRFKKYMDKYYTYKKYFKEKDKHKIKKKSKSAINILIDDYIKKGYKIPNLEKKRLEECAITINDKSEEEKR